MARSSFFLRLGLVGLLFCAVGGLSACAEAWVVSQPEAPSTATKVKVISITWRDNPAFSYNIMKTARYGSGEIEQIDKTFAQGAVMGLLHFFRESVPSKMATQLARNNVLNYPEAVLELTPVRASIAINEAVTSKVKRSLDISASIREKRSDQVIWSVTIQALAPATADNPQMVENFVSMLIKEMRNAGLAT